MKTFFEKYGKIFIISFNAIFVLFFLTQIFGFGLFDGILLKFQYLSVTLDNLWLYIPTWLIINAIYLFQRLYIKEQEIKQKYKEIDLIEEEYKNVKSNEKLILEQEITQKIKEIDEMDEIHLFIFILFFILLGLSVFTTLLFFNSEPLSIKKLANERITSKYSNELEYAKKDIELKNYDKIRNTQLIDSLTSIQKQFKDLGRDDKVNEIQQQIDKLK